MKRSIVALLIVTMLASMTGCGKETNQNLSEENSVVAIETVQSEQPISETENETDDLSDLEALGDVDVEKNLFNVEITIPKNYVGETTQEELTKTAEEKGYKSITLNADGSATYIMTKSQHKELLEEMTTSINETLEEMTTSGDYSFIEIKANDNFTDFTVTTTATELGLQDSLSVMAFYMYGGMYSIFSGESVDNIHVSFVNADTGEIVSQANSKDMQE